MTLKKRHPVPLKSPDQFFTEAKLTQAASPTVRANAEELVDADIMMKRLRDGSEISCTFISFNRAIHCSVSARKYSLQELCTCEANYFCRHAAALVRTWLDHPETFFELNDFLDELDDHSKADLLTMLRRLVGRYPGSSLEVLGKEGFLVAETLEELSDELELEDDLFSEPDLLDGLQFGHELADEPGPEEPEELEDFDDDPGDRGNLN
jgi:hypothetical protein